MKVIRIDEYGGPEVLRLREIELPEPGPGEVRVGLHAAGLNFVDIYYRSGIYPAPLPFTLGNEGAGIVEAIGEGVEEFKPGDRVAYTLHPGSYAEANIVPANLLIPLPDDLSFEHGAAFTLQGLTAHYLIYEYRLPKRGDTVLIHAAAGGMGLLLVQWAKHLGAKVIGTASTEEKAQTVRTAGADHVIIYTEQDFVAETLRLTDEHGADLIIDGVGRTTFAGNLEAAAVRGHVVIYGQASGPPEPIQPISLMERSISVSGGMLNNFMRTREELLRRASDLIRGIREGWLRLNIDRVFPLAEAAEAQRRLESRESIGKIILKVKATPGDRGDSLKGCASEEGADTRRY
jgi:NADPH2:quinone reductase